MSLFKQNCKKAAEPTGSAAFLSGFAAAYEKPPGAKRAACQKANPPPAQTDGGFFFKIENCSAVHGIMMVLIALLNNGVAPLAVIGEVGFFTLLFRAFFG